LLAAAVEPPLLAEPPLPEELLPEEPPLEVELPFPAELPFVGGALPEPPSVPPEATALAESDASAPPHPARTTGIEMAAKFRRTKRRIFFRIVFTFVSFGPGSVQPGRLAFAPLTARPSF